MKAIAWSAVFLVFIIGMSIAATAIVLYYTASGSIKQANEIACRAKVMKYCSELVAGKHPKWNDINPKTGCEKYGITIPSEEDCKNMGFGK